MFLGHVSTFAQSSPVKSTAETNPETILRYTLVTVTALLVIIIFVLSKAIKIAGQDFLEKLRKGKDVAGISLLILFSTFSSGSLAQASNANTGIDSFSRWDIYLLVFIILLLFIVMLTLVRSLFVLMGIERKARIKESAAIQTAKERTWFQKFNNTVPVEEEDSLDMSHDYDGIRELDNKVPSWWTWTFLASIAFAIIYLYRMFVTESLPNQFVELAHANEMAAIEKLEFLKKGNNNVDENTVTMLDQSAVNEGANLYAKNCIACHGDRGQGNTVGPNLTDDYWLHKGSIRDIFYSIKYGWAEKGMKSWKEDFSPSQIAQLASFVKSLHGSNPPGAKDKQGELYVEGDTGTGNVTDTVSANKGDTTSIKN